MPGTFFIAGAGIAGLTLALTLAKFGARVIVLERNAALSPFGAGLQISPNARKILDGLGLSDALTATGLEPAGIDIYPFRRPEPLLTLELGPRMRERFGAPYTVMHRADLAEALYRACRRFANIEVLFGTGNWTVAPGADGVSVAVEDAAGQTRIMTGSAFVGADGVHSRSRTTLVGGVKAQDRHSTAWRTLIPASAAGSVIKLDRVSVLFGPGFHLVCYPLPHRNEVNLVMFLPSASTGSGPSDFPNLPPTHRSPRIDTLLAAAIAWTPWPLFTVSEKRWHQGKIGLIGDAAHAMFPFQAQGAAMAIEDAAVLGPLLTTHADPETAFRQYERLRQPRVRRVAHTSALNGAIFHLPGSLGFARNLAMRMQGPRGQLRRLYWLFGYETPPLPNGLTTKSAAD